MKETGCLKGHDPNFAMRRFFVAGTVVLAFLFLAIASLDAQDYGQHSPMATNLSCNAEVIAPDNTYTPMFSWTFTDGDQPLGDVQTRYSIRVWRPGDITDMWNLTEDLPTSTRMYAGLPLAPNTTYDWSVQVWDRADPAWPSPDIATASFVVPDIGLRVFDGTSTVAIVANGVNAADPVADANRLRISKSGTTYSIALADLTEYGASKIRVKIPSGMKALKKMVAPLPATGLSVGYLDFQGVWGSTDPAAQSVLVTNVGGGTLDELSAAVEYDPPFSGWLNVSPGGPAVAPVTLTVTPSLSALAAGTYTARITVSSGKASNGSQEVKVSLSISAILPTVATSAISTITTSTATGGGNVSSDGGTAVTARGVCWSTSPNPTTANTKTVDGTGTGIFTSNLAGLLEGTPYYVRAYATNSVGTAYGNQVTFTTIATHVIVSPVSASSDLPTESTYPLCVPGKMIDQSGLVTPFVSGVTGYSYYMSQNPKNQSAFEDNCYLSENDDFGHGVVLDFDLGRIYQVQHIVIWNGNVNGENETTGIQDTVILLSENADFSNSATYNTVVPKVPDASVPQDPFVIDLAGAVSARYIRIDAATNHGNPGHYSVCEVAVGVVNE